MERWQRSQFRGAPYNPRTIDRDAKKKLQENLRRRGLVAPITVNRRTKHIVGGHQRIAQVDAIEGRDDYWIDVAVIDVSEADEKALNVFLNGPAQGQFDDEKLTTMLKEIVDSGMNLGLETGFDPVDLEMLLGDKSSFFNEPNPEVKAAETELRRTREETIAMRRTIRNSVLKNDEPPENYVVVVCLTAEDANAFALEIGADPTSRYIDVAFFRRAFAKAQASVGGARNEAGPGEPDPVSLPSATVN